jgi:serine-type D-Ala-D-Ala carboxypeptidase/endopeptidase
MIAISYKNCWRNWNARLKLSQIVFQATGKGPLPIYPESANEFFARRANLQISFVEGADGKVTGLVLHETGHDVPGKKVE